MSSFWYPFTTIWLKCNLHRDEIEQRVKNHTVLSYAKGKKPEGKVFFFGEVSNQEFWLESLDNSGRISPFIRCNIKGVEHETYLELEMRAFRYARFYAGIGVFLLLLLVFSIKPYIEFGMDAVNNPVFLLMPALTLIFFLGWWFVNRRFAKTINPTTDFFRGMLDAETVNEKDVPLVFRM